MSCSYYPCVYWSASRPYISGIYSKRKRYTRWGFCFAFFLSAPAFRHESFQIAITIAGMTIAVVKWEMNKIPLSMFTLFLPEVLFS